MTEEELVEKAARAISITLYGKDVLPNDMSLPRFHGSQADICYRAAYAVRPIIERETLERAAKEADMWESAQAAARAIRALAEGE